MNARAEFFTRQQIDKFDVIMNEVKQQLKDDHGSVMYIIELLNYMIDGAYLMKRNGLMEFTEKECGPFIMNDKGGVTKLTWNKKYASLTPLKNENEKEKEKEEPLLK